MKKYLMYWSIFIVVCAAIFAWWWTRPANFIERVTTLSVTAEDTLFSQSADSSTVYLLNAKASYVKKVIDGCEFHGGTFADAAQTGAVSMSKDAAFKGLFASNHIGCQIKKSTPEETWEFFVKDNFLYFQHKYQ